MKVTEKKPFVLIEDEEKQETIVTLGDIKVGAYSSKEVAEKVIDERDYELLINTMFAVVEYFDKHKNDK